MSQRNSAVHIDAMVQLLHERPELAAVMPLADALATAATWSA